MQRNWFLLMHCVVYIYLEFISLLNLSISLVGITAIWTLLTVNFVMYLMYPNIDLSSSRHLRFIVYQIFAEVDEVQICFQCNHIKHTLSQVFMSDLAFT
jgi:hypothetical protein